MNQKFKTKVKATDKSLIKSGTNEQSYNSINKNFEYLFFHCDVIDDVNLINMTTNSVLRKHKSNS